VPFRHLYCLGAAVLAQASPPPAFTLSSTTVNLPALSIEMVAWSEPARILVGTHTRAAALEMTEVAGWRPLQLVPLDARPLLPGHQGFRLHYAPTAVAAHPTLPVAFVSVPHEKSSRPGAILAVDLREGKRGEILRAWPTGFHPDSVALSADARWLAVACEGQGKHRTPGSLHLLRVDGLALTETRGLSGDTPSWHSGGLGRWFDTSDDAVEPEYAAFDPTAPVLAVSCQENDGVLLVDCSGAEPVIRQALRTEPGAQPDGVAIRAGLVVTADEGNAEKTTGQTATLFRYAPEDLARPAERLAVVDLRPWVRPQDPTRNCDPENVKLAPLAGRMLALLALEDRDAVAVLDVTQPSTPSFQGLLRTGKRPEGLVVLEHPDCLQVITGDEGARDGSGPGQITVGEVRPTR
jgi:hypothetical protein